MARILTIVPYDNKWKDYFIKERQLLQDIFLENAVTIHHIGSTSIEGMRAKPIVDILIEVESLKVVDKINDKMVEIGYVPKGENGIQNRRYFQKGGDERTHHVHCFEVGNPEIERHIVFRDYLIAHPYIAKKYSDLKETLSKKFQNDTASYINGKAPLIHEIDEQASIWNAKRKS